MIRDDPSRDAFVSVLDGMRQHPQGHHGWSTFYETLGSVLQSPTRPVPRALRRCWRERPELSMAHVATLLGMAVRQVTVAEQRALEIFNHQLELPERIAHLDEVLTQWGARIERILLDRHNSFTGARRFLVPQLLIGNFARSSGLAEVRFLDLGTGLGLLPRQLNQRAIFDRFADDFSWPDSGLGYAEIPLACRHGVDRAPLPDLAWVRACHGPSRYYEERFRELLWCLEQVRDVETVRIEELDLLKADQLAGLLTAGRYNAITCNFVLYQYDAGIGRRIVETVVSAMDPSGIFICMELDPTMATPGCHVLVYLAGSPTPYHIATVADAHFIGTATRGPDYDRFFAAAMTGCGR